MSQEHGDRCARRRHRLVAMLTILAIVGTLSACGRYGRPVRPTQVEAVASPVEAVPDSAAAGSAKPADR